MAASEPKDREHNSEGGDAPLERDEGRGKDGDAGDSKPREEEGEPPAPQHRRKLLLDRRVLEILLRRAPGHVVRREVGEKSGHDAEGNAGEEEEAIRDVAEPFDEGLAKPDGLRAVPG